MLPKVYVTGIGVITPIGSGKRAFWDALKCVRSGTRHMGDLLDLEGIHTKIGAPVDDFVPSDYLSEDQMHNLGRASQFTLAALRWALEDGRVSLDRIKKTRLGVAFGTSVGVLEAICNSIKQWSDADVLSKGFIHHFMPHTITEQLAKAACAQGPCLSLTSACASSAHALGAGADLIRLGYADIVLAGGAESALIPISLAGFDNIRALSRRNDEPETASRPFDATRDGFVMGEGAGVLILESEAHAQARNVEAYAELAGYGLTGDAHHITEPAPQGEGAQRAMRMALERGGIEPQEIDYINAHGTSTPFNDKAESEAIKAVFDQPPPTSSTKSQIGHLIGAAGAVEAAATIMALREGVLPATANYHTPDPDCDLDVVPNATREAEVKVALSNSFGFGGHNVSLAFRQP